MAADHATIERLMPKALEIIRAHPDGTKISFIQKQLHASRDLTFRTLKKLCAKRQVERVLIADNSFKGYHAEYRPAVMPLILCDAKVMA